MEAQITPEPNDPCGASQCTCTAWTTAQAAAWWGISRASWAATAERRGVKPLRRRGPVVRGGSSKLWDPVAVRAAKAAAPGPGNRTSGEGRRGGPRGSAHGRRYGERISWDTDGGSSGTA